MMGNGGRIIAISYSPGGRTGSWQPWVAMGAAKSALEVLCRYFAVALAKRGITVNAISPGWTEDSVLNTLPDAAQQLIRNWHAGGWTPMRRLGTPADIGNVVALICSEQAAWITGQVIYADGGASLMNPEVPPEIQTRVVGQRRPGWRSILPTPPTPLDAGVATASSFKTRPLGGCYRPRHDVGRSPATGLRRPHRLFVAALRRLMGGGPTRLASGPPSRERRRGRKPIASTCCPR